MGKTLVIVESPAKAKTINRYLGNDFIVKSSIGHVRDLPRSGSRASSDPKQRAKQAALTRKMSPAEKERYRKENARKQLFKSMGIYPADNWKADYATLPDKKKVVEELQRLAEKADNIYLATDMDREGEAIAWHLMEVIGGQTSRFKRVVFNEITKNAIRAAFDAPGQLNINRVEAQQARRFLDRLVGFMISPLLWEKVARGLSAGRVQSVALRMLVEREREIRAFQPEEYWSIHAELVPMTTSTRSENEKVRFEVTKKLGGIFRPENEAQTNLALEKLKLSTYSVFAREDKPTQSKPPAPYITSTLQQAASTRLGFGVKKTMIMAQRLYEAGHITYMRTDSTNLSADSIASCREYINRKYPAEYLPNQPVNYKSKSDAQEAHEAIRPTNIEVLPAMLSDVDQDAVRLYEMIWRQFLACQMAAAQFTSTKITVKADSEFELLAKGRIIRFDGYLIVQPNKRKNEEHIELPDLAAGDELKLS
jgi:DNA topoisomerase-1